MTYSYTKEAGWDDIKTERYFLLTILGDHSDWPGCVLETPVQMEGQHLQSGLVQSPPLRDTLLQSVADIQISANWRQQGDSLLDFVLYVLLVFCLQTTFENVVIHCQTFADLIPVTFVLGFYVSIILTRYTTKYHNIRNYSD